MTTTNTRPGEVRSRRKPPKSRGDLPDALPCRWCGFAAKHPDASRAEVLHVFGPASRSAANRGLPALPDEVRVTRCAECAERLARAEKIMAEHPRVRREHGSVAVDRLDAALAALDVGRLRGARIIATLTGTDTSLRDTITALAHLGAAAAWSAGYAQPNTSSAMRWGHVPVALAKDIAEAHKRLIRRMTEIPFPHAPASDGVPGCLLCGVSTLLVKESDATEAWGKLCGAEIGTLGGRNRPQPVKGYLCPRCRASVAEVGGAIGMAAVERAVLAHLGFRLAGGRIESWPGVVAWVALRPGTEPNKTPWAHLRLASLARGLASSELMARDSSRAGAL